jgi:hypothetical protein
MGEIKIGGCVISTASFSMPYEQLEAILAGNEHNYKMIGEEAFKTQLKAVYEDINGVTKESESNETTVADNSNGRTPRKPRTGS